VGDLVSKPHPPHGKGTPLGGGKGTVAEIESEIQSQEDGDQRRVQSQEICRSLCRDGGCSLKGSAESTGSARA
jgi:hypothetical protein